MEVTYAIAVTSLCIYAASGMKVGTLPESAWHAHSLRAFKEEHTINDAENKVKNEIKDTCMSTLCFFKELQLSGSSRSRDGCGASGSPFLSTLLGSSSVLAEDSSGCLSLRDGTAMSRLLFAECDKADLKLADRKEGGC
jgi:hypothetical protein